jgi:cell shape-determining protein MreC
MTNDELADMRDEVARLKRENTILREELQYRLEEIYGMCYTEMTDDEAEKAAEQYVIHLVAHNEGAE